MLNSGAVLIAVGVNQRNAGVSDRERLAIAPEELESAIKGYAALGGVDEAVVLSTCYRVEIYAATGCPAAATVALRQALRARAGRDDLQVFELQGADSLRHLARVASSLESAVLGEPQILGQVKEAFARAVEAGAAGRELSAAMKRALQIAKRVRTETAIGRAGVSWGHAAASLAEKVLGPLSGRRVVLVGAGEMARVSAQHLREQGAEIAVVNRTAENAEALAREVGGVALPLQALEAELLRADVLISAAPAAPACLAPAAVAALMKVRRHRRLVMVDLAVPRAIPAESGKHDAVYLCDVDDLARLNEAALRDRSAAVGDAERIVGEEMERLEREEAERRAVPIIQAMRRRASAIAQEEVHRTLHRLGDDPELAQRLEALAGAIVSKLLHAPSTRLRRAGTDGASGDALMAAARHIFDVSGDGAPPAGPAA